MTIRGVLFDFGGVLTTSPFEAFSRYEQANDLPDGFLRRINATNPDTNAWAQFERNEIDLPTFCARYADEATAAGGTVDAAAVLDCLRGEIRPAMVEAVRRCRAGGLATGCITNNVAPMDADGEREWAQSVDLTALFDVVIESSKVGIRKPDPAIYELACRKLGINPTETAFLDDLGINLKPAAAMGMTTIKVVDPDEAIVELETAVGIALG